ncbi:hypothetical protein HGB13_02260 [bacterium]|nr:hypothetical protein [bacterium]
MKTIKKRVAIVLSLFMAFANLMPMALASNDHHHDHHDEHHGVELDVDKSATGHVTAGTYMWDITKTAEPDEVNMFYGDSKDVDYTVNVTKSGPTAPSYYVTGVIDVKNEGDRNTQNLKITDYVKGKTHSYSSWDTLTTVVIDVSSNPVLTPGETGHYNYTIYFNKGSKNYFKNYIKVEVDNFKDDDDDFEDAEDSFSLPNTPAPLNSSVTVNDTNGFSWGFSDSGSQSYTQNFVCGQSLEYGNTATIVQTGQQATANVNINCYGLEVTKTVNTSFDREYDWTISKTASALNFILQIGQTANVDFLVDVSSTSTDKNWQATGNINVYNPAPIAATILSVNDIISPDIVAEVTCSDIEFPYLLGSEQTLTCTYVGNLPNTEDRTNTATVTLQNNQEDEKNGDFEAQALATTDFSDTQGVSFEEAVMNEIDECIDVTNTFLGNTTVLGNVCYGPAQFNAPGYTVGPYTLAGTYTIPTPADFTTNDTESEGDATVGLTITVNQAGQILGDSDTRLPGGSILGASSNLSGSGANLVQLITIMFLLSLGFTGLYLIARKQV